MKLAIALMLACLAAGIYCQVDPLSTSELRELESLGFVNNEAPSVAEDSGDGPRGPSGSKSLNFRRVRDGEILDGRNACGGSPNFLYAPNRGSFFIQSQRYPRNYRNGASCKWIVVGPRENDRLEAEMVDFEIEDGGRSCRYDYLKYDRRVKMCGTRFRQDYTSRNRIFAVEFKSDRSVSKRGFLVEIRRR